MFKVVYNNRIGAHTVRDVKKAHVYLHSDGAVFDTSEYWPTHELAQAVLDKYQPKHIAGLCVLCLKSKPVITKPTRSKNPTFAIHNMPLGCVNQKRDCRTCKLDIAELIAEGCPLTR